MIFPGAFALLLMSAPATAAADIGSQPTPELARAHDCLVKTTRQWLTAHDWAPESRQRWSWATQIVDECREEVRASTKGFYDEGGTANRLVERGAVMAISAADMRRSEALYFVDRLIQDHFEPQS
ncbi:MAG: hypothetical protein AAGA34_00620 [Pseudomonadota bacterium]